MAMETFTYRAINTPTATISARTLSVSFGDGYKQEVADGINTISESWPLTFQGSLAELAPVEAFFRRHGGWRAFLWSPPGSGPLAFKVRTWTKTPQGGPVWTLDATFEPDFKP